MAKHLPICLLLLSSAVTQGTFNSEENHIEFMSRSEREALKEEARDMFYHAYNAYMDNAYPADELMPLTCKGRFRGSEADRGDIDSTLGNFSLTLVDTLDTLVVLGDLGEFEKAVKLVVKDVSFETDVIVSLFETNIRMLGGLLSGHILAEYLQLRADIMPWYRGELLKMAKDLGYRFLPAFNTTTGIPYGRINLMHGMKGVPADMCRETCTACAGSMILEMAALSRLTGESIFEDKAQKAMDALWKIRHRGTDLMGSVVNVHSGDWVRRESGVGAGIDSYYEYCLKAYILLGDEKYLGRFNRHYQAVMKYVSQGPMLLDVHMHRPNTNSKNFMDALLAFWPGLQVLKGDIKPAVETHEMLYQVIQRHNFIPEAFTTDFQVHWGHHPLRPEFLESTYFLYRATSDPYYLGVGRKVLKSLQKYARVPCGYAAVSDVRTNKHDDTMDSFVLSETFKYLFLLFSEPNDLVLDLDEFIFTTEGHLLPLTLATMRANISAETDIDAIQVDDLDRTCPNSLHLFPASVRQPLRNMVEDVCPKRHSKRRLSASQFIANSLEHLKILGDMGISISTMADGRMQLLHTFSNAKTVEDAEEGLLFMQEMVDLNRQSQEQSENGRLAVTYKRMDILLGEEMTISGGPAQFGKKITRISEIHGKPIFTEPADACKKLENSDMIKGNIAIMLRGNCMFYEKAKVVEEAGAIAGIVLDTTIGSSFASSPIFTMSGDDGQNIQIPMVFIFNLEGNELTRTISESNGNVLVTIGLFNDDNPQLIAPSDGLSMFDRFKSSVKQFLSRPMILETDSNTLDTIVGPDAKQDEMIVEKAHLRAGIHRDFAHVNKKTRKSVPLVRLTTVGEFSERTDKEKTEVVTVSASETTWRVIKQVLINQIYAGTVKPPNQVISLIRMENYHDWIEKERMSDNFVLSENLNTFEIVSWFLNELSDTIPIIDSTQSDNSAFSPSQYLLRRLTPLLALLNSDPEQTESLIAIVESYKMYDSLLENVQGIFKQLNSELHKAAKISEDSSKDNSKNLNRVESDAESNVDSKDLKNAHISESEKNPVEKMKDEL